MTWRPTAARRLRPVGQGDVIVSRASTTLQLEQQQVAASPTGVPSCRWDSVPPTSPHEKNEPAPSTCMASSGVKQRGRPRGTV